jgi:diguanylate cyclase (GGDEF)-like protein
MNSLLWDRFELDQWGEREVLYLARTPHSLRHPLLGALLDFYRVTRQIVWQREEWQRLHEELDQSQRFYAALAEINAMVYAAGEEESLLDKTCRIIHNYTKVNGCWAYQMKDNQINLVGVVMDHTEHEHEFRVLFSKLYHVDRVNQDELLFQIMRDQQTITINNCNRHRLFQSSELLDFFHKIPANAICAMPIIKEDHVDTILMMIGPSGFFTKSINEVIEAMAMHVSIKLQSMALESKTKVYHDMIVHMAYHDRLTGLKNRAYLEEQMDRMLVTANNQETTLGLLVMDLDHFKPVNDQFGHQAGDAVLIEVARRMQEVIPVGESIRLGGDEFVIFVLNVNHSTSMLQMAELLIKRIQEPIAFEGCTLSVGASIGMAFAKEIGINPRVLLKAADQALYKVKQSGRNAASF